MAHELPAHFGAALLVWIIVIPDFFWMYLGYLYILPWQNLSFYIRDLARTWTCWIWPCWTWCSLEREKKTTHHYFKTQVSYVLQLLPIIAPVLAPVVGLPFYGPWTGNSFWTSQAGLKHTDSCLLSYLFRVYIQVGLTNHGLSRFGGLQTQTWV